MKKKDIGKKMTVEELMNLTGGRRFGRRCPDKDDDVVVDEPVLKYGILPLYGIIPIDDVGNGQEID